MERISKAAMFMGLAVIGAVLAGCGSDSGFVPVKGRVTNGGQPLEVSGRDVAISAW